MTTSSWILIKYNKVKINKKTGEEKFTSILKSNQHLVIKK